jgi:acetyl-CoA acetyltransferase
VTAAADWGRAHHLDAVDGRVAIVGIGEASYSKASGRTATQIGAEAAERAIADAGLRPDQIDGITWNGPGDQFDDRAFHAHFGTSHELFVSNEGGATTGAAMAPYTAAQAIAAGKATHVLNVFSVAWATEREQMVGGPGEAHARDEMKGSFEVPFGWFPQPVYFATIARRHMHEYGTTPEQLGAVAVTCRDHARRNPDAVMRDRPLTLADHLAQPMVADPLRRTDCCLISDGGAAFVTTSADRAADLPHRPAVVAGIGFGESATGSHWSQQADFTSTPQVFSAPPAFAMAGIAPADVDVLTLYDPATIVSLMQVEDMGFCAKGEAGPRAEAGDLGLDRGWLPLNTHGGLLSHAYVLGIAHVVEVVKQLRGDAGAAQVAGCQVGVYGGYTGGTCATLVLTGG